MKTIVARDGSVHLEEVAIPQPGSGQVLVKSRACGICGSDLHIVHHGREVFQLYAEMGMVPPSLTEEALQISLGHEFCAEIVAYGPDTLQEFPVGQRVTSIPFISSADGALAVGATPAVYGAYSEYFLLQESLLLAVPDGMDDAAVAVTEPMAVGLHAVNQAQLQPGEAALVAGCGPVGLACIAALKQQGAQHIVASDPEPGRRDVALAFGATHVVDPMAEDEMVLASALASGRRLVIIECVGRVQMIPQLIKRAPESACIVFSGIHTQEVPINPAFATVKQLNLRFSYYYTPEEYAECLRLLSTGAMPWQQMLTGRVGIDGVPGAIDQLSRPGSHIKVVVEPWRTGELKATQPER
jgi:threonine dehydrogenase-like Zn-dependent dehydrogenase